MTGLLRACALVCVLFYGSFSLADEFLCRDGKCPLKWHSARHCQPVDKPTPAEPTPAPAADSPQPAAAPVERSIPWAPAGFAVAAAAAVAFAVRLNKAKS